MTEKRYKLVWCPVENADRENIPYAVLPDGGGKLVYKLPSTLTFGHLEFNGVDITGYFSPADIETPCEEHLPYFKKGCAKCQVVEPEYIVRPWMVIE